MSQLVATQGAQGARSVTVRILDPADLNDGRATLCGQCQQVIRPEQSPSCGCMDHRFDAYGFHPPGTSLGGTPMDWYAALVPRCDGCDELQENCNCTPGDCDCDSCLERRGYDEEGG